MAKEKKNRRNQKEFNDGRDSAHARSPAAAGLCEHPTSDVYIAGSAIQPLPETFHHLLQTVSDLMLLLPAGSALQQVAIRCWGIKFKSADHQFLHKSHVFSTISRILSRSDNDLDASVNNASALSAGNMSMFDVSGLAPAAGNEGAVEKTEDITGGVDIKVSSRQAMVASLTDNSTETFWESGDEDRNRTKWIALTAAGAAAAAPFKNVALHVDNGRDLDKKVSSVTFKVGKSMEDATAVAKQVDVESRFAGWINCFLDANPEHAVVKIELKGPDNTLRVRQVKALGGGAVGALGPLERELNNAALVTIQQRNCEAETLRVFRLITGQVFGRLLEESHHENEDESPSAATASAASDLKEHVVGILFSRSKLTHLQKQVCAHIVQAIKKETARFRDEWETLLCSETPPLSQNAAADQGTSDTYCFEMLSMVLALSGSSVGRSYLAQQFGLLKDLLALLHTGSGRIQRQVISLLRRVLPKVAPRGFATLLGIANLPPKEFGAMTRSTSVSDTTPEGQAPPPDMSFLTTPGLLDVFLSCIAKALTLQVKTKGLGKESGGLKGQTTTVSLGTSIHPRDDRVHGGERWWLRGAMSKKIAEEIIALLKDLSQVRESIVKCNTG